MKRITSFLLVLAMVLSLCACGSAPAEPAVPEETVPVETAPAESAEVQAILAQEWVPESIKQDLDETIRWNEMLDMLANVITLCDASGLESWNAIVRSNEDKMQRDDGMLAIYEAACALGIGHKERNGRSYANIHYNAYPEYNDGYDPNSSVFTNARDTAPYEDRPGLQAGWDYMTSARFYSMGNSSIGNPEPFFEYADEDTRYDDLLTQREAITAAVKLIQAYEEAHSGGYTIPETDWEDPLLSDAKAAREAILNSPTTITKGEELILGETYTGTAYYVSNSGDDNNDGKSPETAWATLGKVEKAKLKYGDAVFFERGGTWYGSLKMQYGVTYSAYGEGAKPIITGSPQDAAQEEKWTLYAETPDGGKIWQYTEPMVDAGVILLNGGEMVARKAYPVWNGQEYTNGEGEPYVVEKELADLMFFSAVELKGQYAKLGARISLDEPTLYGPLYLRCDAGNPGEVYDKIEISVLFSGTVASSKGWNAVDNLHFRCYSSSGMNCNNYSNIVYQNCEADWCGGAVCYYNPHFDNPEHIMITISGGGILLFGSDLVARNNYVHDCESKGIAVVINGTDGNPAWLNRTNILAEGNVVERCGSSVYMMIEFVRPGLTWKFEDVRFVGNYLINGNYGWRQRNMLGLDDYYGPLVNFNNVRATGAITFEDNLFYRAEGVLLKEDFTEEAFTPIMQGNTYVQDKGQALYAKMGPNSVYATLATSDQDLMETCVREYIGDTTGEVIILE